MVLSAALDIERKHRNWELYADISCLLEMSRSNESYSNMHELYTTHATNMNYYLVIPVQYSLSYTR